MYLNNYCNIFYHHIQKSKHLSTIKIRTAHPSFLYCLNRANMDVDCVSAHLCSKTLPSAGLQLNIFYLCQAWPSLALQEEIYVKIIIHGGVKTSVRRVDMRDFNPYWLMMHA